MPFSGLTTILNDVWDAVTHALRVEPAAGTLPISGTVTANQGTPNAGAANAWPILPGLIIQTGNLVNSGDTVTLLFPAGSGASSVTLFTNFGTAQYNFQVWDGVLWQQINGWELTVNSAFANPQGSLNNLISPAGGNSGWIFSVAGYLGFRVLQVGASTQTCGVTINASQAAGPTRITDVLPGGFNLIGFTPQTLFSGTRIGDLPNNQYARTRNIEVFKTAQASASGSTALWTPAASKKFRLQRYCVQVTGNAVRAAAGVVTISLLDAAADIAQDVDVWVPAAALNNAGLLYNSGWIDLGNGKLSAAANNVLNISLSAALTAGNVRVLACGTEE